MNMKKIKLSNLKNYIWAFAIPFTLLALLLLFYNSGFGNPVPDTMAWSLIIWNALSSVCFYFYTNHSVFFKEHPTAFQLLASYAYGFSAYVLLQEYAYATLCLYTIFPIVFLSFEQVTCHKKQYLSFILLSAAMLALDPQTAIPLTLILCVLHIVQTILQKNFNVAEFLHYISCVTLSVCLAAFRVFPYVAQAHASNEGYPGFSFSYHPVTFLSRIFPFAPASASYFSPDSMDLYFSSLFLFLSIIYFCDKQRTIREKLCNGFFLLFLFLAVDTTPVQYLLNLQTAGTTATVSYDFILIFWCLILALKAYATLKNLSKQSLFTACGVYVILLAVTLLFNKHNYHILSKQSLILFSVLGIAVFVCFCTDKKDSPLFSHLLIGIFVLELFCNSFIVTNQNFIPADRSLTPVFALNFAKPAQTETATIEVNPNVITYSQYNDYLKESTDQILYYNLNNLTQNVPLSDEELAEFCQTPFPNNFDYANAVCKKLGYDEPLFIPCENVEIKFTPNDNYIITPLGNQIFNVYIRDISLYPENFIIPFTVSLDTQTNSDIQFYNDYTEQLLSLDSKTIATQTHYISASPQQHFTINMQLLFYEINPDVYEKVDESVAAYVQEEYANISNIGLSDYVGLAFSFFGLIVIFILFFNSDKEKIHKSLFAVKNKISNLRVFGRIAIHVQNHYVYYPAFFIPVCLFVLTMIIFDCVPFGTQSFYDEDGLCLTLPSTMDTYYNLLIGNTYMSINGGYGHSLYAMNPLINYTRYLLLLSPEQIAPFLLFAEAFCLGICSFSMVFYLTHRLSGTRAYKKDFRLLVPALLYTLNTYMLAMHGFTSWYYTLMVLPLLFLALDYLMYRKKTFFYVIILAFCMIYNLYHALYICIFLVLYFFTYRFDSFRDFMQKGIRFALSSVLAAINSFFIISNTLTATYDSPYDAADSVFPKFGLHGSYLNEWKNHMIFSESTAVTADNGYVSIYCGILTLLLVLIFTLSKKLTLKEKIKHLIPALILYISFNEKVLSYIWNGFHYQSKVPNRYAFLLMFLLSVMAYEGIRLLPTVKKSTFVLCGSAVIVFFTLCQFGGEGNTNLAYISTLVLVILYTIIFLCKKHFQSKRGMARVLTALFCLELTLNMIFTTGNYALNSIFLFGDYTEEAEYIKEHLQDETRFSRISFPSSSLINAGQMLNTPSNSLFNSFVSSHQTNTNYMFGFYYGTNNISSNYGGTYLTQALTAHRYIYLPTLANMAIHDMEQYEYIGKSNNFHKFENPQALSLGYYIPYEVDTIVEEVAFPPNFYNAIAKLYGDYESDLFDTYYLKYNEALTENTFAFTDVYKNPLSFDAANDLYQQERKVANCNPLHALRMHLNLAPEKSGPVYLYSFEFIGLGEAEAGVNMQIETPYPNPISAFRDGYNYCILNEDVMNQLLAEMSKNQLENITIGNNTITGTTNYEKAGYTMLTLAHDRNWHAYIDGQEAEVIDAFDSFIFIDTPAGEHTLELKYIPYGMKVSKIITYSCWLFTLLGYGMVALLKRRKKA